jgi:hypothetical protein
MYGFFVSTQRLGALRLTPSDGATIILLKKCVVKNNIYPHTWEMGIQMREGCGSIEGMEDSQILTAVPVVPSAAAAPNSAPNLVPNTAMMSPEAVVPPAEFMKSRRKKSSGFVQFVRIFLLLLIIIGIVLLCTQNLWVPSVVAFLLAYTK